MTLALMHPGQWWTHEEPADEHGSTRDRVIDLASIGPFADGGHRLRIQIRQPIDHEDALRPMLILWPWAPATTAREPGLPPRPTADPLALFRDDALTVIAALARGIAIVDGA